MMNGIPLAGCAPEGCWRFGLTPSLESALIAEFAQALPFPSSGGIGAQPVPSLLGSPTQWTPSGGCTSCQR
jgi:hypothetical protein